MIIQPFPTLSDNQVALLRKDVYTGITQNINIKNAITPDQELYTVYESLEDAVKEAEMIVTDYDHIECFIFDKMKNILKHIQPS